ncbi:UDP-Glycosyltransferase/glycogen phosphorylase [Gloeophyllum trabeum ATCC 11539]|uniref:UDP-Glycosyltransferase/glycogen phosphorylase n=1 Tax=Gloeophyllum trabeum (strain ATCC 11539 / FP-39264 / Madison 617) TaxID=670483 RepID=S7RDS7_GLOTA|nr:UDP-Glycosyltransferase/glycogen phosphorylase [Gloeophyllum trabeum ATCC 11539]EPQ50594.1 UDP-Glycosyltransferase/glycogen phosphorylase [Gloeophyllum trabeum ATCC 11539]
MIVGSRGDVQPYVALGKRLVQDGHRVRIATHETFRKFVRSAGLEFFNIGGDPQQLMSYMVKNPGLIPGIESLTNGDIGRKRDMLREMINGCWQACYEPDDETGEAFSADAIISNPPAFGHIHCAEALGIPLLLSFTMPWSPTSSFPHPLVNIKASNAERGLTNYLSYAMAELLTWQGIGDIVNSFRVKALGLRPLSLRSGPGMADRLKVPFTYCLSPSLVPKPRDWKSHIDIVGFYFMPSDTQYRPPSDLLQFLDAGPPPVYIGFGSVVVDDPEGMSNIIVQAVQKAGVRAILFAGWGGLGGLSSSPNILILGKESNVPHDWLFTRVAAVVHHGGAGTTAAGLACGRPTVVVPFFGDQLFWGLMVNRAGAGPPPIPQKELSVQNLTSAIRYAMTPAATQAAKRLGDQIGTESGVERGVESFYRHLPLLNMRCDLVPSELAVWWSTKYCLRLSALAAQVLVDAKLLSYDKLDTHRPKEYASQADISDPVTGGASAIFWTITNYYTGIAKIFYSPVNGVIKTTTAIPKGIADILFSVQEGFSNLPKLYGSEVRAPGKVTNFKSGLKEGGKGLFYGYYDGITGLVREPLEGAKKEGVVGAIKGSARSFVNVTMRPAAGALGLVTHPLNGAWKSLQGSWARKQDKQQETTRMAQGLAAVRSCSIEQRRHILGRFVEARKTTAERRKKYEAEARETLCHESQPKANDSGPSKVPERTSAQSSQGSVDELDAQFERDLEMAKQLSLAESSSS